MLHSIVHPIIWLDSLPDLWYWFLTHMATGTSSDEFFGDGQIGVWLHKRLV